MKKFRVSILILIVVILLVLVNLLDRFQLLFFLLAGVFLLASLLLAVRQAHSE